MQTRPIYENKGTAEAERAIAATLQLRWNCSVVKMPRSYAVDYAAFKDGALSGWIEIKDRQRYSMGRLASFGGFMLSLHKWIAAWEMMTAAGVPATIVVRTSCGVYWHSIGGIYEHDGVILGGRRDRGDDQDIEPVVTLRPERFKLI